MDIIFLLLKVFLKCFLFVWRSWMHPLFSLYFRFRSRIQNQRFIPCHNFFSKILLRQHHNDSEWRELMPFDDLRDHWTASLKPIENRILTYPIIPLQQCTGLTLKFQGISRLSRKVRSTCSTRSSLATYFRSLSLSSWTPTRHLQHQHFRISYTTQAVHRHSKIFTVFSSHSLMNYCCTFSFW